MIFHCTLSILSYEVVVSIQPSLNVSNPNSNIVWLNSELINVTDRSTFNWHVTKDKCYTIKHTTTIKVAITTRHKYISTLVLLTK